MQMCKCFEGLGPSLVGSGARIDVHGGLGCLQGWSICKGYEQPDTQATTVPSIQQARAKLTYLHLNCLMRVQLFI